MSHLLMLLTPNFTDYRYPYKPDWYNLGDDDGEDDLEDTLTFVQSGWAASYSNPSAQQPAIVANRKAVINRPSALLVERLVDGASRDWGLNQLHRPIMFPLSSKYQLDDHTGSTSLGVATSNNMPVSPITGGSTHVSPPVNVKFPPFSQYLAANPTSQSATSGFLQAEPVLSSSDISFSSPNQNLNTDPSAEGSDSSNTHHLVFEEVFQYPKNTEQSFGNGDASNAVGGYDDADQVSKPSSPTYTSTPQKTLTSYPANVGSTFSISEGAGFDSSQREDIEQAGYQSQHGKTAPWFPQKPVPSTQEVAVVQRLSQPRRPPPPPSYIVQSRNGYMRRKFFVSKTSYSPQHPIPVNFDEAPRSALTQPVASRGVKLT